MSVLNLGLNGTVYPIETGRPLSGGVAHSDFGSFLTSLCLATANAFVPVVLAVNGTANLVSVTNVIQTTANGTIANAVINLPTPVGDGQRVKVSTTGAISNVTGSIANSSYVVPAVTSTTAGQLIELGYNLAANVWFRA